MRPKLRDILSDAIGREPDMRLVEPVPGERAGLHTLPDVMICEGAEPIEASAIPAELLAAAPQARVLMIADGGRHAAVYEMRPTRRELSSLSINAVIDAVRHGVAVGPST